MASSDSGSSSSEEEAPRPLLVRPKFIPKSQRNKQAAAASTESKEPPLSPNSRRLAAANALVEEQIKKDLAARTSAKKHWESGSDRGGGDSDPDAPSDVDTTDGLDPEAEEAAWRLRELKRVRRTRDAIEEKERELAEVERRRNLTHEERAAEDEAHLARQREEKDGRGKMAYMQKYFHSGAFYRDDGAAAGLLQRDIMGARIADDIRDRSALPEYLQRRDVTKLGRKGASKYKDMRSEDTGAWGDVGGRRAGGRQREVDDERFRADWDRGEDGVRGANAMPLGERRERRDAAGRWEGGDEARREARPDEGAERDRSGGRGGYGEKEEGRRRLSRSRSRSPPRKRDRSPRRYSRSPKRDQERDRERHRGGDGDGARDRERERDRDRNRDRDDHRRRRRSPSRDRYESDKRRRVDTR
jgi:microfibrillar-associated protein 1